MYIWTYVHMYITEYFLGHKLSPIGRTEGCVNFPNDLNRLASLDSRRTMGFCRTRRSCRNSAGFYLSRIASAPEPEGARNKLIAQQAWIAQQGVDCTTGVECTTRRGLHNRRGMHNKAWNAQQGVDCTTRRRAKRVERSESSEASRAKRVERSESKEKYL